MEDKQAMESGGNKSIYLSSIAILILSLLLSACVATVIFMSLHPATAITCQTPETEKQQAPAQHQYSTVDNGQHQKQKVVDKATLNIENEDGSHTSEEVEYDEAREVAIFHGPNGEFQMDDFRKGTQILKDTETGDCYVVPVGTNKTAGQQLRDYVKQYHGEEIRPDKGETYSADILPGAIDDTSFLPQEAREECAQFHWMSVIGKEKQEEPGSEVRRKRATCYGRLCSRPFYYLGRWYRYCYNYSYYCGI